MEEGKRSNGKLMDICWLILFIYLCSGRGQPDGADNKQMRLGGRCWPGRVTEPSACLSVYLCVCLCVCVCVCVSVCLNARPVLLLAACDRGAHTQRTTLHRWVNLAHEFNYCVERKNIFIRNRPLAIYTGATQRPAEEFITLLIWHLLTPQPH